ncbi:MAG: hypothetical protein JWM74_1850 [Myxococcaceae bacterium]|nr:hypothetical protein [Myxococcaceae bacterium]
MKKLLQRLLDENRKRDPSAAPAPDSPERIAATEAWLRVPLPDDYRVFLGEVGRVTWPMEIGNVLDFKAHDWPPGFVPFARDEAMAHGFLLKPRRIEFEGLAKDLRMRAAELEDGVAQAREEEGERDEEGLEEIEAEARSFRDEADAIDEGDAKRAAKPKTKDLRIDMVSLTERELLELGPDDEDEVTPFSSWLEHAIDDAIRLEKYELARRAAPAPAEPQPETDEQAALHRALDLVDRLVAAEHIEVGADFDDTACAAALVPVFGDAAQILDVLVELPGVEEVFASEDDVESLLASLAE